ncbi:MAG: M20 family metallo-hydrolase [Bacteroidales bacterium]|nr:M20 family metallo-hydrolase [Bacteroidales bacterium]
MSSPYDQQTREAVALLQRMIAVPSVSREEAGVADLLAGYLRDKGFEVQREMNNLWVESPESPGASRILLNSHLDTVNPSASWTRDPFCPDSVDGKLFGLGSNDAGASVVSLLQTFLFLADCPQRRFNLVLALTAEEEVTGKNGILLILDKLGQIDLAIVGEPTDMRMAVAERGLMVLDGVATGKTGHTARREGVNALYRAMDDIAWFRTFRFPEVSPMLGEVGMAVTMIQAGYQHNVVPDKCTFVVDVRTNEHYTNEQALAIIRSHMQYSEVTPRSTNLNSSGISLQHPIIRRGYALGLTSFGSPTLSDQTRLTCPSFKMGPGDSARSHTADEYVLPEEIGEGIRVYITLLKDFSF